jgi:hypothetical protein
MKIRSGFVSNSSSSSFIVGIPKKLPATPESMAKLMFGTTKEVDYYDHKRDAVDIAKRVLDDIQNGNAKKLTKKRAMKALQSGYYPGSPDFWSRKDRLSEKIRDSYREATGKEPCDPTADASVKKQYYAATELERKEDQRIADVAATAFISAFWPNIKKAKATAYEFSYGDESGDGALEHGEIFRNFPHVRISKH